MSPATGCCASRRLLMANVRAADVACRFGGDEFIIVLPGTAIDVATARPKTCAELLHHAEKEFRILQIAETNFSVGVAAYPEHGSTGAELLKAADAALCRAKGGRRSGRRRGLIRERARFNSSFVLCLPASRCASRTSSRHDP